VTRRERESDRSGAVDEFVLRIIGGGLAGRVFPLTGPARLGRSPAMDLVLDHPSVSREHATLVPRTGLVEVTAHSARSATFVGTVRLEPGAQGRLQLGQQLQVGAVLLTLGELKSTEPMDAPLFAPLPTSSRAPLLRVRRGPDADAIYVGGRLLDAPTAVVTFLTTLALSPGVVKTPDELGADVSDDANLHQLASQARRALRATIERGDAGATEWAAALDDAVIGDRVRTGTNDLSALMRRVLLSRRLEGYVLCLPAWAVEVA
jgi:hypothetical protein